MSNENRRTGRPRSRSSIALFAFASAAALMLAALASARGGGVAPRAGDTAAASPQTDEKPVPEEARPGHSEYLTSLTRRATSEGFGRDSVTLLQAERGPGASPVAKRLVEMVRRADGPFGPRLAATDLKEAKADSRILSLMGKSSYLEVYSDGTKFRMRGNIDDKAEVERARGYKRLGHDELERAGREFVKTALRDLVQLGRDEKLTFLGVRYMSDDSARAESQAGEQVVVANIAIFGREVGGVPVVGSGSKIAVWFAGDRTPVGLDVDWPRYRATTQTQRVLSSGQLRERVKKTTNSGNAEVRRFECGYVDLGATRRGALIQSGCSIAYTARRDGDVIARSEFVPAGAKVLSDPKWPLANLIAAGSEMNTDSPQFAAYVAARRRTPKDSAKPPRTGQRGPVRSEP